MHTLKVYIKKEKRERSREVSTERGQMCIFSVFLCITVTSNNNQACLFSITWFIMVNKSVLNIAPNQNNTGSQAEDSSAVLMSVSLSWVEQGAYTVCL